MQSSRFAAFATTLIYLGTLLLSILSFFTTYYGLAILVGSNLAIAGSLGLQLAMLGVAWNLLKSRGNRLVYVTVFVVAATFSVFFSYANFDSALKADTRTDEARAQYTAAVRPILAEYATAARKALLQASYQQERLGKLLEMEREKGWATVIDEGTDDEFIQSTIEGARKTVESWNANQGYEYRQGSGRGIILNFLESRIATARNAFEKIKGYVATIDSVSLLISSALPVSRQRELVDLASVRFPHGEVALVLAERPRLVSFPAESDYIERPTSRQQAFMLVIGDLFAMDHLAAFSLLLAIAIDLIVIIMALAGSHISDDTDYILERLRQDMARRLGKIELDDAEQLDLALKENVERYRKAMSYRLDMSRVSSEFRNAGSEYEGGLPRSPKNGSSGVRGFVGGLRARLIHGADDDSREVAQAFDELDHVEEEADAKS